MQGLLKVLARAKRRDFSSELIQLEDIIMKEYGFIPIETLKKEPIPRIMNLIRAIERRYKREAKEAERIKRPRKR